MRLLLASLFLTFCNFFSLLWPLSLRPVQKALLGLPMLAVGLKYLWYETFGGSFFAPDLPRFVLLTMEALYGAFIILFFLAIIKDLVSLLCRLFRLAGISLHLPLSPLKQALILLPLSLTLGLWGTWQSVSVPSVKNVHVTLPGLSPKLDGCSIVQLSDIHIGSLLKKDWLEKTVEKTNALNPDIIVITGDFIDGLPEELKDHLTPLSRLKARYGVYGVTGNHEYYYDAKGWLDVFHELGLTMLVNRSVQIPHGLSLGGISDPAALRFGLEGPDITKTFKDAPAPRILLSHQPRTAKEIEKHSVALQLSGHTHGGLMFFLAPLIAHFNDGFVNGLYQLGKSQLYINPGSGLWSGFSCRLGVPPEITQIILHPE